MKTTEASDLLRFAHIHSVVRRLPGVDGVLGDSQFPTRVLGRSTRFHLFQRRDDLRLAAATRIAAVIDEGVLRACGYGLPDSELALESSDRRVTLIAQGKIAIDTLILYEIPIPAVFRAALGKKRIIVSLAFDPPVMRRRADYLGVDMGMHLFRGKTPEEIVAAYRFVTKEERQTAPKSLQNPFKCPLEPNAEVVETSTLQRREWTFTTSADRYGETYYLMVQARRNWAAAEIHAQDFGIAVTITADEPRLYNQVQQRVPARERIRRRA